MKGYNHMSTASVYFIPIVAGVISLSKFLKQHELVKPVGSYLYDMVNLGFLSLLFVFFSFLFGTLLVDCDNPKSLLGKYFRLPVPHRGIMHTVYPLLGFLVLSGLFYFATKQNVYFFFGSLFFFYLTLGYFFHLLMDEPSEMSIKWFNTECHGGMFRQNKRRIKISVYSSKIPYSESIFVFVVLLFGLYLFKEFYYKVWFMVTQNGFFA